MICLGLTSVEKDAATARYVSANAIRRVIILSPARFRFECSAPSHEHVEWGEIILYKFYYRLLQEIDKSTLIVINECLRTQNRNDLTYNCIRHFLNQTPHQIVFQYLPIIDSSDDAMILVDFDTRSRWKRDKLRPYLLKDVCIRTREVPLTIDAVRVATDAATQTTYAKAKRELVDGIGLRDPHTIPRTLHLIGGKAKLACVDRESAYVGRNNRFAIPHLKTYREVDAVGPRIVYEWCHNFIDFSDFLTVSRQTEVRALVSDLRVDQWYFDRYQAWLGRVRDAYAILRG